MTEAALRPADQLLARAVDKPLARAVDKPLARPAGSGKPPRSERDPGCDLPEDLAVTMRPIGVVRSPFIMREDAPRQPGIGAPATGTIVLRRTLPGANGKPTGTQNMLKDLASFSHVVVLFWFHHSHGWKPQLVPPRDSVKRGLFATRAPDRPNPLGLSVVRIVDIYGVRIDISGHDLLDGTPVLDLKPYIPNYDSLPEASAGWLDGLVVPGPDHRWSTRQGKAKRAFSERPD
jgi:tRNA-Thr(GGU) m(6)t(6)A37 methyltransferase TsaA